MVATLVGMAKQKPTGGKHKPRRMVGIPERLAVVLEQEGQLRMMKLTDTVKAACIEYLTARGMWPPPTK